MGKRVVELDGLRGLAALFVVVGHYFGEPQHGLHALAWAWIGVDVFFVLSGFLIGGIVLDEASQSGFIARFYLRRAARILPVYLLTIASVFVGVGAFANADWAPHPLPVMAYLTFTQNFVMSAGNLGGWLEPTWTLAVEEQFYLAIPLLIMFLPRRWVVPTLAGLWLSAIVVRAELLRIDHVSALTLLPGRADLLLSGVFAAVCQRQIDVRRHLTAFRMVPVIAVAGLVALAAAGDSAVQLLGPTLIGVGAACFILCLVNEAPEAARFRSPVLRFFGLISYALYLFHQPVAGVLHGLVLDAAPDIGTPARVGVGCLAALLSVGLATMSWFLLEQPILALVKRHIARGSVVANTARARRYGPLTPPPPQVAPLGVPSSGHR